MRAGSHCDICVNGMPRILSGMAILPEIGRRNAILLAEDAYEIADIVKAAKRRHILDFDFTVAAQKVLGCFQAQFL